MSGQQQDKSRDKTVHEQKMQLLETLGLITIVPSYTSSPSSDAYFNKFKGPTVFFASAFRPYQPQSPGQRSHSKKPDVIRKHRGNYRKYTVAEKEEAVKQILEGVDAKEISEKYGIPRRNLLRWKKNGCERKEGGGRPTDGEMQITLYTKIDQKILLTEKDIRAEAKHLSKLADFKASKGWYCKFSRRYNQWKKQQRLRIMRQEGKDSISEKDVFLLPEISCSSDSDQSEDSEDSLSIPMHAPRQQE